MTCHSCSDCSQVAMVIISSFYSFDDFSILRSSFISVPHTDHLLDRIIISFFCVLSTTCFFVIDA